MNIPKITPATTSLTSEFAQSDTIFVADHMPNHKTIQLNVNGQKRYKQNTIIDLFNESNMDYKSKNFIFNHYLQFDDFGTKIGILDNFFLKEAGKFKTYTQDWKIFTNTEIYKNLTFMSNKPRPHRIICATILANLFDIDKLNYTYQNMNQYSIINSELLIDTDYSLDVNKILPDRWAVHNAEHESSRVFVGGKKYKNNHEVFTDCLYNSIYHSSATSLITEPNFYEHGCMFTEKTLMAIYSGHFMIWIGSWKAAETARRIGIDTFDDIIDHTYQYVEHPGERVVEAILKNLDFLKNIHLQQDLRNSNIARFNNNLNLVRNLELLSKNINSLSYIN